MDAHYKRLNKKLDRLQQKQKKQSKPELHKEQHFYPRIKNLKNIRLNEEETIVQTRSKI
jgi:hypothetical protein